MRQLRQEIQGVVSQLKEALQESLPGKRLKVSFESIDYKYGVTNIQKYVYVSLDNGPEVVVSVKTMRGDDWGKDLSIKIVCPMRLLTAGAAKSWAQLMVEVAAVVENFQKEVKSETGSTLGEHGNHTDNC